jgi:hypothetical protein
LATKIVSTGLWPKMRVLAQRTGPRLVAVPFVGKGAGSQLPLRSGDILIARLDEPTVKAGLTHPGEILKYLRKGVEIHAAGNLHAKVFVLGKTAIIGSTNVSTNSATKLIEAAAISTDRGVVLSCRDFVNRLRGDVIGPEYVRRLEKLYRPPRLPNTRPTGPSKRTAPRVLQSPILAVPLVEEPWEQVDERELPRARAAARKRQKRRQSFVLEEFLWYNASDIRRFKLGQRVLQCIEAQGKVMVSPPARVLAVRRYMTKGTTRAIICVEVRRNVRRKSLGALLERLGSRAKALKDLYVLTPLRDTELVYGIGQVWPNTQ